MAYRASLCIVKTERAFSLLWPIVFRKEVFTLFNVLKHLSGSAEDTGVVRTMLISWDVALNVEQRFAVSKNLYSLMTVGVFSIEKFLFLYKAINSEDNLSLGIKLYFSTIVLT